MRLSSSLSSPKKGRLGPRAAMGTLGSRERGMSPGCSLSCTASSEGEKPGDNKGAVGAGLDCLPHSPISPRHPDLWCPSGCGGLGAFVGVSPFIRAFCWEPCLPPRVPHWGERDKQRGAGESDRRILGFWPPGLCPAVVGGKQLRGGDAPAHHCREGGRGREGEKGAVARRSRAAGRVPDRGERREGRACLSAHVLWKILCPASPGDEPGRARGAPGTAVRGEVGRGAGRWGEDYSSRRARAGRVPGMAALPGSSP